jgi:hypothetical protein
MLSINRNPFAARTTEGGGSRPAGICPEPSLALVEIDGRWIFVGTTRPTGACLFEIPGRTPSPAFRGKRT